MLIGNRLPVGLCQVVAWSPTVTTPASDRNGRYYVIINRTHSVSLPTEISDSRSEQARSQKVGIVTSGLDQTFGTDRSDSFGSRPPGHRLLSASHAEEARLPEWAGLSSFGDRLLAPQIIESSSKRV